MFRYLLILITGLFIAQSVIAQSYTENHTIKLVNIFRAKQNLPAVKYQKDYFDIESFIQSITQPIDTSAAELNRILNEVNSYLGMRLDATNIHINYAGGVLPKSNIIPENVLVSILKERSSWESVFYNYDIRTLMPIVWAYQLYDSKMMFIYLISFE